MTGTHSYICSIRLLHCKLETKGVGGAAAAYV